MARKPKEKGTNADQLSLPSEQGLSKSKPVEPKGGKNVAMTVGSSGCVITNHFVWTGSTWVFAYAILTGQCCNTPPIPPTPPSPGTMISVECSLGSGGESSCDCCEICASSLEGKAGIPVCIDGNCTLGNTYPTGGGPWAPAFDATGNLVWVNLGGL